MGAAGGACLGAGADLAHTALFVGCALIELGFISTPDEEQFLHSNAGVSRLASGIYQAFVDYKKKHHSSQAAPAKVSVADATNVIPQEKPREEAKASKRNSRKSKVIQDLADAREGKVT